MSEPLFPIMESARKMAGAGFPRGIPWSVMQQHEAQALRNHDQTLKRLSERGGLSWSEAELILLDRAWDGRIFILPRDREAYEKHERAAAERVSKILSALPHTQATESPVRPGAPVGGVR